MPPPPIPDAEANIKLIAMHMNAKQVNESNLILKSATSFIAISSGDTSLRRVSVAATQD